MRAARRGVDRSGDVSKRPERGNTLRCSVISLAGQCHIRPDFIQKCLPGSNGMLRRSAGPSREPRPRPNLGPAANGHMKAGRHRRLTLAAMLRALQVLGINPLRRAFLRAANAGGDILAPAPAWLCQAT